MFELTPWKPFKELSDLRREMDRMWDTFFFRGPELESISREWSPSLDVSETKDNITVKAEVPGMDAKDIDISLSGDVLTIKGEKKQEKEEKGENFHRIESCYGAFSRSIRLPVPVKSEEIKAGYKKGVLRITLPKKEEVKPKQIAIKPE